MKKLLFSLTLVAFLGVACNRGSDTGTGTGTGSSDTQNMESTPSESGDIQREEDSSVSPDSGQMDSGTMDSEMQREEARGSDSSMDQGTGVGGSSESNQAGEDAIETESVE